MLSYSRKQSAGIAERIVILGAGEVGKHIMQRLAADGYNVIIIDRDEEKLKEATQLADVGTFIGDGGDATIYKQLHLNNKDLFIAVTNIDEINLVACRIVKEFKCLKSIARVTHNYYQEHQHGILNRNFWKNFGIDTLFNQSLITIQAFIHLIEMPGALEVIELQDNIELVAYKVKENSLLHGRKILSLRKLNSFKNILIAGVSKTSNQKKKHYVSPIHIKAPTDKDFKDTAKRSIYRAYRMENTLVPKSDYVIQEGDILYLCASSAELKKVNSLFDPDTHEKKKNIFILGASDIAHQLADQLSQRYPRKRIYLIASTKKEAFYCEEKLNPKIRVLLSDVHNIQELINEGLGVNSIFIGASDNEDDNVVACLLVEEEVGAMTLPLIHSSIYIHLIPYLHINSFISSKLLLVDDVLRALRSDVYNVFSTKWADAEVLEIIIHTNTIWENQALKDITFPTGSIVLMLIRDGKVKLVDGDTVLHTEDHVFCFVLREVVASLQKMSNRIC